MITRITLGLCLIGLTACGDRAIDLQREDEDRCRDSGNVVLWADPLDQRHDTMMIACVTPEKYADLTARTTPTDRRHP